ncbi:accessory factor associated with RNA polymerase II [Saitoella coloradoensis]
MDALEAIRKAIASGVTPTLLPEGAPVTSATEISLGPDTTFSLTATTRYRSKSGEPFDLRAVWYAYLCKDLGTTEYIQGCSESDIRNLNLFERKELVGYLDGSLDGNAVECLQDGSSKTEASANQDTTTAEASTASNNTAGSAVEPIPRDHERVLTNHNLVLRGTKRIDFFTGIGDYTQALKKPKTSSTNGAAGGKPGSSSASASGTKQPVSRNKQPIIIIPSSPSSLLTMHNIKRFLEEGVFVPPEEAAREKGGDRAPDHINVVHQGIRLKGRHGEERIKFLVVDSVEKFKPEYWDRVVAVFTTGQKWQFGSYRWTEPTPLFQNTQGLWVAYSNQPNDTVKAWNVKQFRLDQNRRHGDRQVQQALWNTIEGWMISKGWNK